MSTLTPPDHPQRYPMTLELHARPFPALDSPCEAIHIALTPRDAAEKARMPDHLAALVARFGGPPPAPDAAHYFAELGRMQLKWERHTEFCAYTFFLPGHHDEPFALPLERVAPADWLADAPGSVIAAIRVHVESCAQLGDAEGPGFQRLFPHFTPESLAAAAVGEGQAAVMGDFRIHPDGFSRFAVLIPPVTGARRLGRIVQRLIEIETYRIMAMLALPTAREAGPKLSAIADRLNALTEEITAENADDRDSLAALTSLSAEIETVATETGYRFAASRAYAALVEQRIDVLREKRFANRQSLHEFMARRFEPAMRTMEAVDRRRAALTDRAARTAALLSTRVNVAVEAQNQDLLASMNRRAELQLQLQHTVEGLSVVAISYYAVGLAGYVLKPLAKALGASPEAVIAVAALPIVAGVWLFLRRLKRSMGEH